MNLTETHPDSAKADDTQTPWASPAGGSSSPIDAPADDDSEQVANSGLPNRLDANRNKALKKLADLLRDYGDLLENILGEEVVAALRGAVGLERNTFGNEDEEPTAADERMMAMFGKNSAATVEESRRAARKWRAMVEGDEPGASAANIGIALKKMIRFLLKDYRADLVTIVGEGPVSELEASANGSAVNESFRGRRKNGDVAKFADSLR